ncbi:N-acetyltransferase 6 isoform X2 [Sipha flava]|uniref:N-acetyltransferase 6 isoform X2 n=1 Tax=Sipha flava TaxID=143950 RepID=A0A8B8GIP6_9HEMI|nr:N-acetyltransferase 6 isoform X2 [Sipha flava]
MELYHFLGITCTLTLHSLEASCDTLPTSLVLVKNENTSKVVLGHSKITPIPSMLDSCFIESVVIVKDQRGRGLGKYIMYKTEEYIKTLGLSTVYLSTIDKKEFYSKLGYVECQPVSIYGNFSSSINKITAPMIKPSRKTYMKKQLI